MPRVWIDRQVDNLMACGTQTTNPTRARLQTDFGTTAMSPLTSASPPSTNCRRCTPPSLHPFHLACGAADGGPRTSSPGWTNSVSTHTWATDNTAMNLSQLLFMHELGHLVGLAHSSDPRSFMYPYLGGDQQGITASDRLHLAYLGKGGCGAS